MTFWYLSALIFSVLPQPAAEEGLTKSGEGQRKNKTFYRQGTKDHLELPPGDPVSVRLVGFFFPGQITHLEASRICGADKFLFV